MTSQDASTDGTPKTGGPQSGLEIRPADATLMRIPASTDGRHNGKASDVAIVGVPSDGGAANRPGARFAPNAIREASRLSEEPSLGDGINGWMTQISVVDVGNLNIVPSLHTYNMVQAQETLTTIARNTRCLAVLGGDHSVLYPAAAAVARISGPISLIHFDAHADTWPGSILTHATAVRKILEDNIVQRVFQFGLRGYGPSHSDFAWAKELGVEYWAMGDIETTGLMAIARGVMERVSTKVYISIDIDVLDPAFAPGTGTPEPGGLTSEELLTCVRTLATELEVVAMDVVEVCPPYDIASITSIAASQCVVELLAGKVARLASLGTREHASRGWHG